MSALLAHGFLKGQFGLSQISQDWPSRADYRAKRWNNLHRAPGVTFNWTSSDTFLRDWRQRVEPKERKQHSWITPLHHLLRLLASLHAVKGRVEIKLNDRTQRTRATSFRPVSLVLSYNSLTRCSQCNFSLIIAFSLCNRFPIDPKR